MIRTPVTIGPEALATEALHKMEEKKITSLPVVDGEQRLLGSSRSTTSGGQSCSREVGS